MSEASNAHRVIVIVLQSVPFVYGETDFVNHPIIVGSYVSAISDLCHVLGYLCKLKQTSGLRVFPNSSVGVMVDVLSGRVDFAMDAVAVNPKRAQEFEFIVSPFYRNYEIIVHVKNTEVQISVLVCLHVFLSQQFGVR